MSRVEPEGRLGSGSRMGRCPHRLHRQPRQTCTSSTPESAARPSPRAKAVSIESVLRPVASLPRTSRSTITSRARVRPGAPEPHSMAVRASTRWSLGPRPVRPSSTRVWRGRGRSRQDRAGSRSRNACPRPVRRSPAKHPGARTGRPSGRTSCTTPARSAESEHEIIVNLGDRPDGAPAGGPS